MTDLVLRRVEVEGTVVDVSVAGGRIAAIGTELDAASGATQVDGRGGALIAGLHDHHLHLMATAAAAGSVAVGPADVHGRHGFTAALRTAAAAQPSPGWLRAVGYHESVAGDLHRAALDAVVADRPVRVQHRSGVRWILNSMALRALGMDDDGTGCLDRGDDRLQGLWPETEPIDLRPLGAELASYGVTGVTDATPYPDLAGLDPIAAAVGSAALPQRVTVMGGHELAGADAPAGLTLGPVKVVLDEHALPPLDDVVAWIELAHRHARPVAVHCVTRATLVLALAAWDEAASHPGDRVEHGSVIPAELVPALRKHRLTVVTQPGFVAERGDEYLHDVTADDQPILYRCRTLIDAEVGVAGSTDAPYSHPDPWRAIVAATTRATRSGAALGPDEAVTARQALDLFLGPAADAAGPPRRVQPGAPADLCLLTAPLADALDAPSSQLVAATIRAGQVIFEA